MSISAFSQSGVHLRMGAGVALGDWASVDDGWEETWGAGLNIRFVIDRDDSRFSISPNYIYFPVSEFSFSESYFGASTAITVDPQMHYVNVDARFAFLKKEKLDLYAIVGPGYLFYYEEIGAENSYYAGAGTNSSSKATANVGLGVQVKLNETIGFYGDAVYSYAPDDFDQALISIGLLVKLF